MDAHIAVVLVIWGVVVGAAWVATRGRRRLRLGLLGLAALVAVVVLLSATGWGLHTS